MDDERERRDRIEAVLALHVGSATQFCTGCSWVPANPQADEQVSLRGHQADMVAAMLREEQASAASKDPVRALVAEWFAECVEVTGDPADTVRMSEVESSFQFWMMLGEKKMASSTKTNLRRVLGQSIDAAGGEYRKHDKAWRGVSLH